MSGTAASGYATSGLYAANGFLHDFSVALALSLLLLSWWIGREAAGEAAAREALLRVRKKILRGAVASLAAVAVTGIVRTMGYRAGFEGPVTWTGLLLAKHLLLLSLFGAVVALGAIVLRGRRGA